MTTIPYQTLRAAGLNVGTVSLPSDTVGRGKSPRRDTERLIVMVVGAADRPVTRLEIARRVGQRKTPWLISIIEGLVIEGAIQRTASTMPNGVIVYLYHAMEG